MQRPRCKDRQKCVGENLGRRWKDVVKAFVEKRPQAAWDE